VFLALLAALPAAARADDTAALTRDIAAPWPGLQREDGSYYDYLKPYGGGRYSEAMLGLALLQVGLREGDDRLVSSGLRGVGFALAHGERQAADPSVFEAFALATAYNVARGRLTGDPRFEALRAGWEDWLRRVRPVFLGRPRGAFFNKHLVEACAWLELWASGLRSSDPAAVLFDPRRSARAAIRYVNRHVPRLTSRSRGVVWGRRARLLADPAPAPLAYHALSLGLLARAVDRLGHLASPAARRTLAEAAQGTWGVMAPDGDVAYTGRSQDHVWALAYTAYGSALAAPAAGTASGDLQAVAERALARLRGRHPLTPLGIAIAPGLSPGTARAATAMDVYADAAAYAGLTLVALDWLVERGGIGAYAAGRPAADRPGSGVLHAPGGDLGLLRARGVWLAVRSAADERGDLRSDFGLVALKRTVGAAWEDVLPTRPRASDPAGAGPIRIEGTERLAPMGRRLTADGRRIRVTGSFGGGSAAARAMALTVSPTACGARLSWPAPAGSRHELSVFFAPPFELRQDGPRELTVGTQVVRTSGPATAAVEPGYASARDPELARARVSFGQGRGRLAGVVIEAATGSAPGCRSGEPFPPDARDRRVRRRSAGSRSPRRAGSRAASRRDGPSRAARRPSPASSRRSPSPAP
jgi:hypothetical protein